MQTDVLKSDILSSQLNLLKELKNSKVKNLVRYSWNPPEEVKKELEDRFHISASSVFRRTAGSLLITLESGIILGFAYNPSQASVTAWIEQTEDGVKRIKNSTIDDDDLYPIDASDAIYSEKIIKGMVGSTVKSVSILKREDPDWSREVPGEVGLVFNFEDGSEFIASLNLSENIDDFAIIFRDEIDPEILDQLQEIPV
jgi:hypothetical protein